MTAVRADVAAMLHVGATSAQVQEQLHVSEYVVRLARQSLGMAQAKRSRAELDAIEERAVAMLRAGATLSGIYAELRLGRNRITQLRKLHGIPVPERQPASQLTFDQAFALHTQPTPTGGHLLWIGPRSGRGATLCASGVRHNPRKAAFLMDHGREPEGRLFRLSSCDHPDCIAGAHLTDRRIRQAHAHADQAFDQIFGPDA